MSGPARHALRLTEIKLAVGKYEFSIAPRLVFATDGTMLHGSLKSTFLKSWIREETSKVTLKRTCMLVRTGITAYTEGLTSMARECRLVKKWTGLRLVPTWLTI